MTMSKPIFITLVSPLRVNECCNQKVFKKPSKECAQVDGAKTLIFREETTHGVDELFPLMIF